MEETRRSSNESNGSNSSSRDSKSYFIRTIIPFLLLQFSVGLCASLQATFYPIEATLKGASASQFGAVFGIIHLSLFMFGPLVGKYLPPIWNIDTSTKLYSIDIEVSFIDSVVIQDNLVKIASFAKIYVFDGTTIEDKKSVIQSKREISLDSRWCKPLFNKSMVVYEDAIPDTVKIMNFWI